MKNIIYVGKEENDESDFLEEIIFSLHDGEDSRKDEERSYRLPQDPAFRGRVYGECGGAF